MRTELGPGDPAAETLADALDVARRAAVGGQMRETGRRIDDNRLGDAAQLQQTILGHLQELLDTLASRRVHELERRVHQLEAALKELHELQAKQQALRAKAEQAAALDDAAAQRRELDRLQADAGEAAEQVKRLSRRLERLLAERAAQTLAEAASCLDQTAAAAQQGDAPQVVAQAREAEQLLEQAEGQLDDARGSAGQELLHEQMQRLEQDLAGLARRQKATLHNTVELDVRHRQQGRWTRAQLSSVGTLAREQRAIELEAASLAENIAAAPAFALALRGVLREMDRAARGLNRQDTGALTQQAEQNALMRLQQMQEALQRDETAPPDGQPPQPADSDGRQAPSEGVRRVAELKLLKLMQQEIYRRTAELENARVRTGTLTGEQVETVRQLAEEQGRLAAMIGELK